MCTQMHSVDSDLYLGRRMLVIAGGTVTVSPDTDYFLYQQCALSASYVFFSDAAQ